MRADRLIATLLLLQSRGRMSARTLAEELEVSPRTVMRDIEALGSAGVPIYSVRGPAGGYELWQGFRTQLTGLSSDEAAALAVIGSPGAASVLGLSEARGRLELKLSQALPAPLRGESDRITEVFYDEEPTIDPGIAERLSALRVAILRQRVVTASTAGGANTRLEPLGLVRSAGCWHVVVSTNEGLRVVEVSHVTDVRPTGARFERPPDFRLRHFWRKHRPTGPPATTHLAAEAVEDPPTRSS